METQEFLSTTLSNFVLVAIPIIFGVWAVNKEMITLLASEKFSFSHHIVPYVILGTMLYSTNAILAAGLFIYKKTYLLTGSLVAGAILNILLNLFLIPRMGVTGAAISTLIAYIFVFLTNVFFSFRYIAFRIDYKGILVACIASVAMFLLVKQTTLGTLVYSLVLKITIGISSYVFLLMLLHKRIRSDFMLQFQKLSKQFSKSKKV